MEVVSRLYVDANIIIHLVEHKDDLSRALTDLFTAQDNGQPFLVTSEFTLTELLIGPCRDGDDRLVYRYEASTWSNNQLEVVPVTRAVLWDAAVLRSQYSTLKTPDAIHVSTAIGMRCSHILTADQRLANRYELTNSRYGLVRGPAMVEILRPEIEVVRELTEIASQ